MASTTQANRGSVPGSFSPNLSPGRLSIDKEFALRTPPNDFRVLAESMLFRWICFAGDRSGRSEAWRMRGGRAEPHSQVTQKGEPFCIESGNVSDGLFRLACGGRRRGSGAADGADSDLLTPRRIARILELPRGGTRLD